MLNFWVCIFLIPVLPYSVLTGVAGPPVVLSFCPSQPDLFEERQVQHSVRQLHLEYDHSTLQSILLGNPDK